MMCFIHYISAIKRLTEIEKTVSMLQSNKYSEEDVPPMVLAQRDFVKKEKEYFRGVCINWLFILAGSLMGYYIYWIFVNRLMNHA